MPPTSDPIGTLTTASGEVSARSEAGELRTLSVGDHVYQDDVILTAAGAKAQMTFQDGTVFSQGASSEVLLDVYLYNPDTSSGELLFEIAQGSMRAVSGEIVKLNPEGFNVKTPLSTVGIRGTSFFVLLNADGEVVGVQQMDPDHVVVIGTGSGEMTIGQAGEFVAVQLDGFLSDPAAFTPEFLQSIQEQIPMSGDPVDNGDPGQGDDPGDGQDDGQGDDQGDDQGDGEDGEEGENDADGDGVDDDLQGNLLAALQTLQQAAQQGQQIGPIGTPGEQDDPNQTAQDILDAIYAALGIQGDDDGDGDDDDLIETVQEVTETLLNLKTLPVNTDGTDYQNSIEGQGYNAQVGTAGGDTMNGTADKDAYFGLDYDDTLTGAQNNDIIFGGAGADTLTGGDAADIIYGGEGNDFIFGSDGSDYLVGGSGDDEFKYDTLTSLGDTIRDFTHGEDKIMFSTSAFQAGNFGAKILSSWDFDQTDLFAYCTAVYDPTTAKVWVDVDGNGTDSNPLLVATLENAPQDVTDADFSTF